MLTIQTQGTQLQVRCRSVAFAGSRHGSVDPQVAGPLVGSLSSLGFSFFVGCAPGIDACFRDALSRHESAKAIVACARSRIAPAYRVDGSPCFGPRAFSH